MKKLTTVIIDDEDFGRKNLRLLLQQNCPNVSILADFGNSLDAIPYLEKTQVDLLFLDIRMPVGGFDFLEMLPFERTFDVVFVTAYSDYGIPAIKAGASDYVLKPISPDDLQEAVSKVSKKRLHVAPLQERKQILVKDLKGTFVLYLDEIICLEGMDYITQIHLDKNRKLSVTKTLKYFEEILPEETFFRVHKSHIVNLSYVETYGSHDGGYLMLRQFCQPIQIARRRFTEFVDAIRGRDRIGA